MAQVSKKDQIAEAALPLFLTHGIKGTSVDMVVKAAKVSKPTVYNHFPDKANLLLYVVENWLTNKPEPSFTAATETSLNKQIEQYWLDAQALAFYSLFIGEQSRAPAAKETFKNQFDLRWRSALKNWAAEHNSDFTYLNAQVSHTIISMCL